MPNTAQIATLNPPDTKRQERAHRILDAASALILRWGYDKTTIDDIAKQAGVAKGTIYLHWKTREDLFRALIQREQVQVGAAVRERLVQDPMGVTLGNIYKHTALVLLKRPLMKAIVLSDVNVLGKLAHTEHSTDAYQERLGGFRVYLDFLREHEFVRSDLDIRSQLYAMSAIIMGFFLIGPLVPEELTLSDEEVAGLIGETIHRTLETEREIPMEELHQVSQMFIEYFDLIMTTANQRFQQELGV